MRYQLDTMLPIKAFSPRNGRGPFSHGMTLEGGGGGIVSGIGDALASIDPGPAIGDAGVSIDNAVNDAVPGGWVTVGALAMGGAALAFAPEIMAAMAAEGLGGDAAFMAADAANLASQGLSQAAIAQNLAMSYGLSEATATAAAGAALGEGAAAVGEGAGAMGPTYGELGYTGVPEGGMGPTYGELGYTGLNQGQAIAAADAAAAPGTGLMGPTYGELGYTGVPEGGMGPTYAEMGYTGLNQEEAIAAADAAAKAGSGFSAVDALNYANKARQAYNLAKGLTTAATGTTIPFGTLGKTSTGNLNLTADTTGGQNSPLDLVANITKGNTDFSLLPTAPIAPTTAGTPVAAAAPSYAPTTEYGMKSTFADGGVVGNSQSGNQNDAIYADKFDLRPVVTKGNINFTLPGREKTRIFAEGGEVDHQPQFYSEGGLGSIENRYVTGDGDGTSDSIPAMLANGEFVIPADVVSGLGNGSNDAGAQVLDQFLKTIREHKRRADSKHLPADSKGPLAYLTQAQKKVKA